jgi:catechol 2,3-dioxygenase-like lactoylglutathione lyase family enzyme
MEPVFMTDVIGIDHIYITVSDLEASEHFYDRVMIKTLGFRKNKFSLAGDLHIQYFNRHFGFVLRPSRALARHEPYAPGLHHFCLRVDSAADVHSVAQQLRAVGLAPQNQGCIRSTRTITRQPFSRARTAFVSKLQTTGKNGRTAMTTGIRVSANKQLHSALRLASGSSRCGSSTSRPSRASRAWIRRVIVSLGVVWTF